MTNVVEKVGGELRRYYYAAEKRLPHNWVFTRQARRLYGALPYLEILRYLHDTYGFRNYLEIGIDTGNSLGLSRAALNYGVDPDFNIRYPLDGRFVLRRMTSDAFFAAYTGDKFDFVFIDGLHVAEQVSKDVFNAVRAIAPGGLIAVHDTVPMNRVVASPRRYTSMWTGDVYRALVPIVERFPSDVCTFLVPPAGLTFIRVGSDLRAQLQAPLAPSRLDYHTCLRRILTSGHRPETLADFIRVLREFYPSQIART